MIAQWIRDILSGLVAGAWTERCGKLSFFGKCGWQNGTSIAASRHRTQSGLLFSWTSPKIKSLLAKSCSSHHLRSRTYVIHKKITAAG